MGSCPSLVHFYSITNLDTNVPSTCGAVLVVIDVRDDCGCMFSWCSNLRVMLGLSLSILSTWIEGLTAERSPLPAGEREHLNLVLSERCKYFNWIIVYCLETVFSIKKTKKQLECINPDPRWTSPNAEIQKTFFLKKIKIVWSPWATLIPQYRALKRVTQSQIIRNNNYKNV